MTTSASRSRGGRGRVAAVSTNGVGAGRDGDAGLVALPGERLSKAVGNLTESDLAAADVFTLDDLGEPAVAPIEGSTAAEGSAADGGGTELREDDAGRRRRRRGGRGRGRGRGRDETSEAPQSTDRPAASDPVRAADRAPDEDTDDVEEEEQVAPRGPRTTPFGSVWDSQLGTTAAPSTANLTPLSDDDEDFDEPEIPEYLIAEQRRGARGGGGRGAQGSQGGRGGPRGGRAAYQSAVERERYGRGGGGGINRYPDVSGRTGGNAAPPRGPREERGPARRDERPREAAPRAASSSEPWSEVPPELEALLRAQVGQQPGPARTSRPTEVHPAAADAAAASEAAETDAMGADAAGTEATEAPATKRRTTRKPAASRTAPAGDGTSAAPKRRSTRKTATSGTAESADAGTDSASAEAGPGTEASEAPAPKRRTTRKPAATATDGAPADTAPADDTKPKRRTTRKTATSASEPG